MLQESWKSKGWNKNKLGIQKLVLNLLTGKVRNGTLFEPNFSFLSPELAQCSASREENSLCAVSFSDFSLAPIAAK